MEAGMLWVYPHRFVVYVFYIVLPFSLFHRLYEGIFDN
jgi:hypothetical protein